MRASGRRPDFWRRLFAEVLGTFAVTIAAIAVDVAYFDGAGVDYASRWLARGCITIAAIFTLSDVSGAHLNPAITLGFVLRRDFPVTPAIAYVGAQFAGAFAAAWLASAAFGASLHFGASHPGPGASPVEVVACETILTAIIMLTIFATGKNKAVVGKEPAVAIGLAIAACGFFGGPISGASMNPARSIAPQVLSGGYGLVWMYLAGPCLGAALAAILQTILCGTTAPQEKRAARGRAPK